MTVAGDNYERILSALRDGPLTPRELQASTGLTKGQIGWAMRQYDASTLERVVTYDSSRRVYLTPKTGGELARALIPELKGVLTRISRTLSFLDAREHRFGITPDTRRERKTLEAHQDAAQARLKKMREVAADD